MQDSSCGDVWFGLKRNAPRITRLIQDAVLFLHYQHLAFLVSVNCSFIQCNVLKTVNHRNSYKISDSDTAVRTTMVYENSKICYHFQDRTDTPLWICHISTVFDNKKHISFISWQFTEYKSTYSSSSKHCYSFLPLGRLQQDPIEFTNFSACWDVRIATQFRSLAHI